MNTRAMIKGWIAALACALASPAQAQEGPEEGVAQAQRSVNAYFAGEKRGAIGFMSAGGASVLVGGVFALTDSGALKGAAIPTLTLGAVDLIIGVVVYSIADSRAARLSEEAARDPQAFKKGELERIGRLDTTFEVLYGAETVLLLGGLGMAVFGRVEGNDPVMGFGLGLAAQMPPLLILDGLADTRGELYIKALEGVKLDDEGKEAASGDVQGGLLGLRGVF